MGIQSGKLRVRHWGWWSHKNYLTPLLTLPGGVAMLLHIRSSRLTMVFSNCTQPTELSLRHCSKMWSVMTSPPLETHPKTITVWGNLVFRTWGPRMDCRQVSWFWQKFFSSKNQIVPQNQNVSPCSGVSLSLFCKKLTFVLLIWLIVKVLIQDQLYSENHKTHFLCLGLPSLFPAVVGWILMYRGNQNVCCVLSYKPQPHSLHCSSPFHILLFSQSIEKLLWLRNFDVWHKSS